MSLEQCPRLVEELFQMAAGEKREEHPHQRVVTIRPEEGYRPPRYHERDDGGHDDQHDSEETRVAKPLHSVSLLYNTFTPVERSYVYTLLHGCPWCYLAHAGVQRLDI